MGSRHARSVIGILVLWMSGLAVLGQQVGQEEGPEFLAPWHLSVKAGGEYSDNRDGTKTNKESNLDGTIEPNVNFVYQDADRTLIQLMLIPVLKWHSNPRTDAEGSKQRETELFGSVGLELMYRVTPTVTVNAGDRLAYSDDPQEIKSGSTVRQNQSYVLNDAHTSVDAALTPEAGVGLKAQSVTTRYQDGSVAGDSDSDIRSGEVDPRYVVGSGWTLLGQLHKSEFEEARTEHNRGSYTMTSDAGIEKAFTPDFICNVMGGYQTINYDSADLGSAHSINGNAGLVFKATGPTRFRLGATYGYTPPSISSYSAQKATTVSGGIDHDVFAERLTVRLQGEYTDGRYKAEGPDALGGSEKMTRLGVQGTYYLSKKWSLTGGYSFENWKSALRESFTRNLVDMSVTAEW